MTTKLIYTSALIVMVGISVFALKPYLIPEPIHLVETPIPNDSRFVTTNITVMVHIAGAVVSPGVYSIPVGVRVLDALDFANGPLPNANLNRLNLAKLIYDGQRILVPLQKSSPSLTASRKRSGANRPELSSISINTSSETELVLLPGIGPSLAKRIVDYRQQYGRFLSPKDLEKVSGIGKKKALALKKHL